MENCLDQVCFVGVQLVVSLLIQNIALPVKTMTAKVASGIFIEDVLYAFFKAGLGLHERRIFGLNERGFSVIGLQWGWCSVGVIFN